MINLYKWIYNSIVDFSTWRNTYVPNSTLHIQTLGALHMYNHMQMQYLDYMPTQLIDFKGTEEDISLVYHC